jgi:hypothetical protein
MQFNYPMKKLNTCRNWILVILCAAGFLFFTQDSFAGAIPAAPAEDEPRTFIIHAPVNDLTEFRQLVKQASRLKPFGRVEVNIGTLADKGFYEIPAGNNFWYEYASYNPTPYKYFPDPLIAPFIPADFVRKNKELLLAKAKILRESGLEAAFWCYEPNFIPEPFFEAHPEFRGPRVDHPRRNNQPAFAPCMDLPESRAMTTRMVAELLRNVPEIHTFFFKTNDAGSGICWSDWQYTGPNGPAACKDQPMGERVAGLMQSFLDGGVKAGKEISIYLTGSMFSDAEKEDILNHLPPDCHFQTNASDEVRALGSEIVSQYPVRGLFDPVYLIREINRLDESDAGAVFVSFRSSYDRGYDLPAVMDKQIGLLVKHLENKSQQTKPDEKAELSALCTEWAGERDAQKLFDAFEILAQAKKSKQDKAPGISGIYWGVSARHITRPLVFDPRRLSPEEEITFLPHVFNASADEARLDYTDIHGAHITLEQGAMDEYLQLLRKAANVLSTIGTDVPESQFITGMTRALRIQTCIMQSCSNFGEAQMIRDRNAARLDSVVHRPDKNPTWEGDTDLRLFNRVMRNELDNTQELISLLKDGGMEYICHAADPGYEDTFLLGPGLIDQLVVKRNIMLTHWTDIEGYLTTPFK